MVRRFATLLLNVAFATVGLLGTPAPARAGQINSIVMHAARVAYYSNRFVVTGDGDVHVSLTDGTTITGRTFAMDLKLNRFIVAGGVTLTSGTYRYEGAAFSEFLDFRRGYFLPVSTEPDRWTFINENYIPDRGREMPGDAFALPDLSGHPFILSQSARITPKEGVGFSPARIYTMGAYTPTPDYYLTISSNPNFAQNSLQGAIADLSYPFIGSPNATTALHLRYDNVNKAYLAIEQHLIGQRAYAVFSIDPLTRPQKQYNFLDSIKTSNNRFQFTSFFQVSSFQYGFSQPWSSSGYENVQLTYALPNSFLQFTGNQFQNSLLAQPQPDENGNYWYGDPGHPWVPGHPNNFQLAWIGADHRLNKTPINYRLRMGMLTAHDSYGLGTYGGVNYTSLWQHFLGFTVWTNPLRLSPASTPSDHAVNFQLTYDRQRTIVSSFPRYQDQATTTATISKQYGSKGSAYVAYVVSNFGDFLGPLQDQIYPSTVINNPYDGKTYPGWAAFDGFATSRDLQFAYNWTPTPYFSLSAQLDQHTDFPEPIPFFYGNPPISISARTQFRVNPHLSVTVQRGYFFNFANEGWSPSFSIQFGP